MTTLSTLDEVDDVFLTDHDAPTTLAVIDARSALYLLSTNEDGRTFYQGIPMAEDEEGERVDRNNGWLWQDMETGPVFPLELIGKGLTA